MTDVDPCAELARWLRGARNVVVLTGAGMSAESGIPTFREAHAGLWSRFDPQELASPAAWRRDKALVWGWYAWRMAKVRGAQPHAGHRALAGLGHARSGLTLVTQNVDDLHERAGSEDAVHLHGSLFASRCFACARPAGNVALPPDAADSPSLRLEPPACTHCGGSIRPGVVWFGEALPQDAWERASQAARECEVLIAVGTSGVVQPAASLPASAKARGAKVAEINPVATDVSNVMDLVWRAPAGEALPLLVAALGKPEVSTQPC